MVSRRTAAALGLRLLLAQGRPADLEATTTLIADEIEELRPHRRTLSDKFIAALAARLGRGPEVDHAGLRRSFYYLWKERRLPVNVDPHKSDLKDELERARLARIFEQGLDSVVGYALPIQRAASTDGSRLGQRPVVSARRAALPHARRFADGPAPAARFAAVGERGRLPVPERDRSDDPARRRLPERETVPPAFIVQGAPRRRTAKLRERHRCASPSAANPPRGSSAPRCASSRARAGCTSSCRRWRRWRIISISSPPSKTPPRNWARPSSSKATRRRTIRG